MKEQTAEQPWTSPLAIHEVPETGRHVELSADNNVRTAIAKAAGLRDLPRLTAAFDISRDAVGGLHVTGQVSATVGQVCVVTLEPIENKIEEVIDLTFAPPPAGRGEAAPDIQAEIDGREPPEPLVGGKVDLGAIATEFMLLAVDPYPRKPDAVFEPPAIPDDRGQAFAALAALKKAPDGGSS
jgi:uncharacterized metal-binding protein YceD (DUF177 family)